MIIEPTFNDAHFHSPKHVQDRAAKAPVGPPVLGWPATSPPKALGQLMKDDDKKAAAATAPFVLPGEPEKVHHLEPNMYKSAADNNQPGPRTTFYAEAEPSAEPNMYRYSSDKSPRGERTTFYAESAVKQYMDEATDLRI